MFFPGGLRSLNPVRSVLTNLGVDVIAAQVGVGGAYRVIKRAGDGSVTIDDDRIRGMLEVSNQLLE